jgi:hypothetical protein
MQVALIMAILASGHNRCIYLSHHLPGKDKPRSVRFFAKGYDLDKCIKNYYIGDAEELPAEFIYTSTDDTESEYNVTYLEYYNE